MKLSSGKPVHNATRNDLGKSVQIPRHSQLSDPRQGPKVPGGAVGPASRCLNRQRPRGAPIGPRPPAAPSAGPHISEQVRLISASSTRSWRGRSPRCRHEIGARMSDYGGLANC